MGELETTLRFALIGLGTGSLYAISALGLIVIHRGSKTLNFAHGGLAVWGGFLYADLRDDHGLSDAAALAVVVGLGAVFGALAYLVVIRPIRHSHPLTRMVATLGLLAVLTGVAERVFEGRPVTVRSWLPLEPVEVLGQSVGRDRLILLALAVIVTAALTVWSGRARLPLATRAMSEHESAAQALGVSPHRVGTINWALGCGLATLCGALVVPIVGRTVAGLTTVVVFALAAALVGRFESFGPALLGGLVLGGLESLMTHWAAELLPADYQGGWSQAAPFLFVLVLLLARRDRASNRLAAATAPAVNAGAVPLLPVVAALAGTGVAILVMSTDWVHALTITLVFVVLGLSLVILIGWANQISLAHMSIAGLGALVAAKLSIDAGVPFELAPAVGAVVGAVCGVVMGGPALRIRGANLAVVTIGMAVAVSNVVFANATYTGGIAGLRPDDPTVFGVAVDATTHPRGYALVVLFWLAIAVAATLWLRRSKLGRQLLVMRANERAAAAMGISVPRCKLAAFVVSSAMAGAAGVLLGFRQTTVTFDQFGLAASVNLVIITVIGGVGSALGAVVAGVSATGGVAYRLIDQLEYAWLREHYGAIFGAMLVMTVLLHPNGIAYRRGRRRPDRSIDVSTMPRAEPAPLEVSDVSVRFGGVVAVSGADLRVEPGSVVGLVGPNGAGKTTLLDAVCGFTPASGSVVLGDAELLSSRPDARARRGVGRMFQGGELIEDLSVLDNLVTAAESAGGDGSRLPASVPATLDRFGLTDKLALLPGELSLAERRFAALARTLAGNPAVVLLDEPGAGLSMTDIDKLADELRWLATDHGLGVLVIDHDMGLVMRACDRIVVMGNGEVIAAGTPAEIRADPAVQQAYLGGSPELAATAP